MLIKSILSSLLIVIIAFVINYKANAQVKVDSLSIEEVFSMSLEEILNLKLETGSLSNTTSKKTASALTIITKEQIQISQARNIATLLEIYVPGMMLMTHQEGDKIGIRGLIAAENYKLLLLVNGKNITNMVYEGAFLELDQWDMSDIERIEIIRGPGSVTYGTGAIAGVINIIPKNAYTEKSLVSAGLAYDPVYRSKGGNLQFSDTYGNLGVYAFTSYRTTLGYENPDYYIPSVSSFADQTDVRYIGKMDPLESKPQPYLADGLERPQLKAHIDLAYKNNFKFWTRYTQSGQTHYFTRQYENRDSTGKLLDYSNHNQISIRSFATSAQYNYEFSTNYKFKINLTYDNQEYIRYSYANTNYAIDHYNNVRNYAFSQARFVGDLLLDLSFSKKLNIITGYQFNSTSILSPWGTNKDRLLVREGVYIISDTTSSVYYLDSDSQLSQGSDVEQVGQGIKVYTHSHLLESNYKISSRLNVLFASRLDFVNISSPMFSPRLSVRSDLNSKNTITITAQRSLRMLPLRAQYLYNKYRDSDTTSIEQKHESLNSIELAYIYLPAKNTLFKLNAYYNKVNTVGYTGNDLQFLGFVKLFGLDFEMSVNLNKTSLLFNHAYLLPIDVHMNDELKTGTNRNNISFSDYYLYTKKGIPILLESYGSGLNNWANNSTRLVVTQRLLKDRLILHANSRIFWNYKGSYDELKMYENAYDNFDISQLSPEDQSEFELQKQKFEREKDLLEKQDAFSFDIKLNASISYKWALSKNVELFSLIYADNLLGSQKRYYVSTGSNNSIPERLRFLEEPRTLGIKLQLNFL